MTRGKVQAMMCVSWILSSIPMISAFVYDSVSSNAPECYRNKGFCWISYYNINKSTKQQFSWVRSLIWVAIVGITCVAMVAVYGYMFVLVNKLTKRNPTFKKRRTAFITALSLIISFFLAYIYYFVQHIYAVVWQDYSNALQIGISKHVIESCPACVLVVDFLVTGMTGAIMDPIIYCVRMKEVKTALKNLCAKRFSLRKRSLNSTSGYIRAAQHSVTVDVTEDHL